MNSCSMVILLVTMNVGLFILILMLCDLIEELADRYDNHKRKKPKWYITLQPVQPFHVTLFSAQERREIKDDVKGLFKSEEVAEKRLQKYLKNNKRNTYGMTRIDFVIERWN